MTDIMHVTSYNKDFEWPKATDWGIKKWRREQNEEQEKFKKTTRVYRNSETLSQLDEDCLLPLNHFLVPKPILQTNPLLPYPDLNIPKDDGTARLTRPRVYKAPEISLDDIEDQDIRKKVIEYTYSTTLGLASKNAEKRITKRRIPNSAWEPPYHVLFSKENGSGNLECEEEVTDTKLNEWDRLQSRALGNSTMAFWQRFKHETPVKLIDEAAISTKSPQFTNEILRLGRKKKLRQPYELRFPYYTGFMPDCPIGMEWEKCDREISDPMQTVNQLANRWREQ